MTYNTTTGALTQNFTPEHSSDPSANTPAAIAVDNGGDALFIADQVLGEVSSFAIDATTGAITPEFTFANSTTGDTPVGVALAVNTSVEFLFTANFGASTISSFVVTSETTVNTPPTLASGYNGAKGIVVDPQNVFVYTADSGDGTVGRQLSMAPAAARYARGRWSRRKVRITPTAVRSGSRWRSSLTC